MVVLSLYRGNVHRRWLMPTPKISLKDFKSLLGRCFKAFSCHRSAATSSNPNPDSDPEQLIETAKVEAEVTEALPVKIVTDCEAGPSGEVKVKKQPDDDDFPAKDCDLVMVLRADLAEKGWDDSVAVKVEKVDQLEMREKCVARAWK